MFNKCVVWTTKMYCMACFHSRKTDNLDKCDRHELRFPWCIKVCPLLSKFVVNICGVYEDGPSCVLDHPVVLSTYIIIGPYVTYVSVQTYVTCTVRWYITLTIASTIDNTWAWHVGRIRVSDCVWNLKSIVIHL